MDLPGALEALRRRLDGELFPLAIGRAEEDRRLLREMTGQLDDYLLPRLRAIDAPLLAVVGGSTGAGKSTLVNSLVGADVAEPGVLRPTTLVPTLVASPADRDWFMGPNVLPGLSRTGGPGHGTAGALRVVTSEALGAGLALLDAPDIDSVVTANRELAAQLLAAADLWLFVTTAARYADEVPWSFLRLARERSTALAVVLDRVPPEATEPVTRDLERLLVANGLDGTRLFTVPEAALPSEKARLPAPLVAPISAWLAGLADDAAERARVVRQTLSGALDSLAARVPELAEAVRRQQAGFDGLRSIVSGAYAGAMADFDEGMRDGSLLRGEVLARWQDFIGTGDLMRSLESRVGWLRDRLVSFFTGRVPAAELRDALESGVETLIRGAADAAAERALDGWSAAPGGPGIIERIGAVEAARLGRASPDLAKRAEAAVRGWQEFVMDLVRQEGSERRTTARLASFGVNGAGLLIMLAVFASTGGLTGIEVGIAGGTSVLSQKLLEAIFGDQAVRTLTVRAREDLRERVRALTDEEAARYTALLEPIEPPPGTADALLEAAGAVRSHRAELPDVPGASRPDAPGPSGASGSSGASGPRSSGASAADSSGGGG
ncbi:dynamin family protein [Nonomuraea roseoviolacea subsp. roseoviolacea]|uniref:Energy-coupling factor transporter ATP-binding protein EcfA2 n=1 Tax=Nonomuraea roseoviolacea subsp. carminata TaxID=160689 RepID=A0ABT1K222_9ACTN|nr:ABC transporter [Nonomuraea roseoviolacea]MCP2348047.1 energy-coupling factor transporter ATP-binding protein EcfA2 [Nonomuraea roseoviolacea subsp. carminata]